MRLREADLVVAVIDWVSNHDYQYHKEFPLLGRVVDVLAFRPSHLDVVAIECKERNWSRGMRQLRVYQAAVETAYLAVPLQSVTLKLAHGVATIDAGLLGVHQSGAVDVVVQPRPAPHRSPRLQEIAWEKAVTRWESAT